MGLFNFLLGGNNSSASSEPSVNIDGTPMCGGIDINGNPYGVTSTDDSFDHNSSFDSFSSFDDCSCGGFDDW